MVDVESLDGILKFVGGGTIATGLIIILYGGMKADPWWVFARYHAETVQLLTSRIDQIINERDARIAELTRERDEFRDLLWKAVQVSEWMVQRRKGGPE
jgi:hypothetical protein